MNRYDPLYYEKLGERFEEYMSDYDVAQRLRLIGERLMPAALGRDCDVLEVGCGTGRISGWLRERFERLTVNDVSEKLCREVAGRLECRALPGDAARIEAADGSFALVVSSEVVEHTPQPYLCLGEMARVLRPGGWLVVTTPNRLHYPVLWVATRLGLRRFQGLENWTWPLETRGWLAGRGFEEAHFSGCHLFPWQLPLAKSLLPALDSWGDRLYPLMINYGFRARKGDR